MIENGQTFRAKADSQMASVLTKRQSNKSEKERETRSVTVQTWSKQRRDAALCVAIVPVHAYVQIALPSPLSVSAEVL